MNKSSPKKSEMLEVRISYETKQKLLARADADNLTISDIIRSLISSHLENTPITPPITTLHSNGLRGRFKQIFKKPVLVASGLLALIAAPFIMMPIAAADTIAMTIEGEVVKPYGTDPEGINTRSFETHIEIERGEKAVLALDGHYASKNLTLPSDGLWVTIELGDAKISGKENGLLIKLSIIDKTNGEETTIAEPSIVAAYNETAQFTSETDGANYSLKFSPKN